MTGRPDGMPEGATAIHSARVYRTAKGKLVITAEPDEVWPGYDDSDEEAGHDCDTMGCGWEHVIMQVDIPE